MKLDQPVEALARGLERASFRLGAGFRVARKRLIGFLAGIAHTLWEWALSKGGNEVVGDHRVLVSRFLGGHPGAASSTVGARS